MYLYSVQLFSGLWSCERLNGGEKKDKHVPSPLHNLSESVYSCLGAITGVPVYPERVRPGRRVAKATGNSACMVVKEEGVCTDSDNWRHQGTPLCIRILHTPF